MFCYLFLLLFEEEQLHINALLNSKSKRNASPTDAAQAQLTSSSRQGPRWGWSGQQVPSPRGWAGPNKHGLTPELKAQGCLGRNFCNVMLNVRMQAAMVLFPESRNKG